MMKPTECGNLDDATATSRMDVTVFGAIHLQGLMRSPSVVVVEVAGEDAAQVPFIHHDHVVEAFSTDASDESFDERILPRTSWGSDHLVDAHVLDTALEVLAVDAVTIAQEEPWSLIPGESIDDLLSRPGCSWIRGDAEMQDAPTLVGEDEEDEEDLIPHGRHDEEVNGHDVSDVILQEALPRLRRRLSMAHHVLGDGGPGQCDPDLLQFTDNVRRTP